MEKINLDQTIREFFEQNKNKEGNKVEKSLDYYFPNKKYKKMVESFPELYSTHLCQDEDGKLYLEYLSFYEEGEYKKIFCCKHRYFVEDDRLRYLYVWVVERTKCEYETLRNHVIALGLYNNLDSVKN